MAQGTQKAYAKIVGPGWIHYMMTPCVILGRGPASVDVVLGGDSSVSRRHAKIEFSPDLQAFEISVIGKNGIFVNGVFLRHGERPRLLCSHTDIIIGRNSPVLMTFYLPRSELARRGVQSDPEPDVPSMVTMVGQLLIAAGRPLNSDEIYDKLLSTRVRLVERLGPRKVIESSIRAAITGNSHIFETVAAFDLDARARKCGELVPKHKSAAFSVKKDHQLRFLRAAASESGVPNGNRSRINGSQDVAMKEIAQ